jgi:pimeloyl-ACP methyl ester carboxylesterase
VLSRLGWVDKENGPTMETRFKQWTVKEDGSHYLQIWDFFQSRAPRPIDILARDVLDVMKAGEISEYGHVAVARYTDMPHRLQLIRCPTLIIWATTLLDVLGKDHDMSKYKEQFRTRISMCSEVEIPGGSVFLPQQMPDRVAEIVLDFLAKGSG